MRGASNLYRFLILLVSLSASACGVVQGRVSSAVYGPPKANSTFVVIGSDNLSLTERNIQAQIAAEMEVLGFRGTTDVKTADLAVIYSYSIGGAATSVTSSPDFVWGGQKVASSTEYPRYFQVAIVDLTRTTNPKNPVLVWQAELYSSGASSNIAWLAERFVPELFKRYGKTVKNERFMALTTY
jgi:hypothetical protein